MKKEPTHLDKLQQDLKALYQDPRPLPDSVDQQILQHISLGKPQRKRAHLLRRALGVAAILLIGLGLFQWTWYASRPAPVPSALLESPRVVDPKQDFDILDAYWLARQLKAQQPIDAQWDLNTDGHVDQEDIQLVAQMAVSLDQKEVL